MRAQKLQTLDLFGVLLDRQRVHGADRLESRRDAGGLRLERLDVEVEHGRGVDQLVERSVPFRLDSLDDAPSSAGRLRQSYLERMTLLARTVETRPRVGDLLLRITEGSLGQGQLGLRLRARRLELVASHVALGQLLAPFILLRGCRGGIGLEPGQLLRKGEHAPFRLVTHD